jgi:tRNA (guanosine-2'-O-)-methyltransferase
VVVVDRADVGQLARVPAQVVGYQELTVEEAERVCRLLEPLVSPARQARFDAVLAKRTRQVVLVLEDVHRDHNNAAVLRTADAMGLLEVHHVSESSDVDTSAAVALGSEKWLERVHHRSIARALGALRARGYATWAAAVHGESIPVDEVPVDRPLALVFGNEHRGISPEALAQVDGCFRLPMVGFVESLNISVAAALSMDRILRRSGRPPLSAADQLRLRACWCTQSVRSATGLLERAGLPRAVMSRRPWGKDEDDERS